MQLDEWSVRTILAGRFGLDGGAMFGVVPKTLWERRAPADALNRITLGMRPLLIRTSAQTVLVDAGAGDKYAEKALAIYGLDARDQLDASLAAAGVAADDIDLVIASHLHWDHVGGLTRREGDRLVPRFPRARHVVRRGGAPTGPYPQPSSHHPPSGVSHCPSPIGIAMCFWSVSPIISRDSSCQTA